MVNDTMKFENDEEENVYTKRRKFEEVERMTPKHLLKPGRHFQSNNLLTLSPLWCAN